MMREPKSMIAVATAVGETAADARRIALPQSLIFVKMRTGQPLGRVPTIEEAEAHPWTDAENAWVDQRLSLQAVGTTDFVRERLDTLVAETGADGVILAPQGSAREQRTATLEALAPAAVPAPR